MHGDIEYTSHWQSYVDGRNCRNADIIRMDEQVLLGLGAQADANAQVQALQYFEQLKTSSDGWKLCAQALSSGQYHNNDHAKFFCFQVVEHYLKTSYRAAMEEDRQNVKSLLLGWIQIQSQSDSKEKTFIRNKVAQLFSLVFVQDYLQRWQSFFTDLLNSLQLGVTAVDMYLRILVAIDSEVVDREIVHTQQEVERNTLLKDTMRDQCVPQLVSSWYQILTTYETEEPEIVCQCLEVIGAYVSWIDITLIANDKFVPVLIRFMKMELLRESTCDCIHEIISKGMDPVAKTKLIESFTVVLDNAGVINFTEDEDGDFMAKLSKLVNGIGMNLIGAWQKLAKSNDIEGTKLTHQALENKVAIMLKFLGHSDDDVSGAVSQFAHDYVSILKQMQPINQRQREQVETMLYVVIKKMTYDESYNFEQEGEDEAMFQEYRKELKVILNNLAALDSQLVIGTVHGFVNQTLQNWETASHQDVEIAITLMYTLGEAIPASHGQHFSGSESKASALQQMMRLMVTSRVSCKGHTSVLLQYFETVVRYDKFFSTEPQHIPEVLMSFLDERGLRNSSPQVSSRTAYLFSRFIKTIRSHIQDFIEDILNRLGDLLILNSPDNGLMHSLSANDQLFLYEAAGILTASSQLPSEKKQMLMKQLLAPVVSKFDSLLSKLEAEPDEQRQLAYAQCINQAMAFASRASKGFSNQQTMKQCGCVEPFTETLQVFLNALHTPVHRSLLHTGVRQYLHRMVVCLEGEILPFIPRAMESLLHNPDAKELHDFIPLINQVVSKFKKHIVPFLEQVFMPIVSVIFTVLSTPVDERDLVAANEKRMLQRGYFSFLATLVNNNVTEVLSNQDAANMHQVLLTVIQGAVEMNDPQAQKTCFIILKKLVEVWGGKDGLNGFEDFMYKSIVPACFMAPMKSTFDLTDAQTILALGECAACMKSMFEQRGDRLILYLQNEYLPTLNMTPELIQEYSQALKSDPKVYRNYLKSFFTRAKS